MIALMCLAAGVGAQPVSKGEHILGGEPSRQAAAQDRMGLRAEIVEEDGREQHFAP